MTKVGRRKLTQGQARLRLRDAEWPGAVEVGTQHETALIWVPFSESGELLNDDRRLAGLKLPEGKTVEEAPVEGRALGGRAEPHVLWPYWLVSGPDDAFALVDASSGDIAKLDFVSAGSSAVHRLAFFMLVSIFMAWMASFLFAQFLVVTMGVTNAMGFTPLTSLGLMLAPAGYFAFRLQRLISVGLREPLWRAVRTRVRLPGKPNTIKLLNAAGRIFFLLAVVSVLFALTRETTTRVNWGALTLMIQTVLIICLFVVCRIRAEREVCAEPEASEIDTSHPLVVSTQAFLWMTVIGAAVVAYWDVAARSGLPLLLRRPAFQANTVEMHLLAVMAMLVLVFIRGIDPMSRWCLLVGLGTGHLAELLLGSWGEAGVPLCTVALVALSQLRSKSPKEAAVESVRLSIRFNIAAATGRLLGRVVGGVLLGTAGIMLGEVLGETILALFGLKQQASEEAKPIRARLHQLAMVGAIAVGVIAVGAIAVGALVGVVVDPAPRTAEFRLPRHPNVTVELPPTAEVKDEYKLVHHGFLAPGSCAEISDWYQNELTDLKLEMKTPQRTVFTNGNATGNLKVTDPTQPGVHVLIWQGRPDCHIQAYSTEPL